MKKYGVAIVAVILAGAVNSWAVTNTFTVTKFRGTLTKADGTKIPIKGSDLTASTNVELVVSDNVDGGGHFVDIRADGVSVFSLYSAAFTAGGEFNNDWFGCFTP